MSGNLEHVQAKLNELKQELQSLETTDGLKRESLERIVRDIDAALDDSSQQAAECQTMIERLRKAAQEYEDSHPNLFRIVGGLIDGLGQIGI